MPGFSRLWLHLTATRAKGFVRFSGLIGSVTGEATGRPDHRIEWRAVADGRRATMVNGIVEGDTFEAELEDRKGVGAWTIVELRQSRNAIAERFGLVIKAEVPAESVSCRLEPLPDDATALSYIASHRDLIRAFADNPEAGRLHYRSHGAAEGREISFQPLNYAASYPDVFELAHDPAAAVRHYITTGFGEGRGVTFNAFVYGAGDPELARVFGADAVGLARHYVQYGFLEGRDTERFDWRDYAERTPGAPRTPSGAAAHFLENVSRSPHP